MYIYIYSIYIYVCGDGSNPIYCHILGQYLHRPPFVRFPEKHRGAHVSKALAAARSEVEALLGAPQSLGAEL